MFTGSSISTLSRGSKSLVFLFLFLVGGAFSAEITYPDIQRELLEMAEIDRAARTGELLVWDLEEVDRPNTQRLKEIVGEIGWPTISLVGENGSVAAWLLAQHADRDPEFQKEALLLMGKHIDSGEVRSSDYAYLFDRVHQPQRFGTQGSCKGWYWEPREIESPEKLDSRRESFGLGPFSAYKRKMDELCSE